MAEPSTHPTLLGRLTDPSDAAAWREFEARYGDLLVRYARRRGLQPADAEDVRQLVLLSLSKTLPGFKYDPARGRFRDYLGRAVRNATFRVLERPISKERPLGDDELRHLADPHDNQVDETWEREWMEHHLRRALGSLRRSFEPRSMQIFTRLIEGHSVEAVAQEFGTTTQAVHKIKQRLRRRLEAVLAGQLADEEGPSGGA